MLACFSISKSLAFGESVANTIHEEKLSAQLPLPIDSLLLKEGLTNNGASVSNSLSHPRMKLLLSKTDSNDK